MPRAPLGGLRSPPLRSGGSLLSLSGVVMSSLLSPFGRAARRAAVAASLPVSVRCSPCLWGWAYLSSSRPSVVRSPSVLGGVAVDIPLAPPGPAFFRLGSAACRARVFRFCFVPPSGAAKLRWVVWCGRGRVPARAAVLASLFAVASPRGWLVL